jgi:hypothetical protein
MGAAGTEDWGRARAVLSSALLIFALTQDARAQSPFDPWDLAANDEDPFAAFFPAIGPHSDAPTSFTNHFTNAWTSGALSFGEVALDDENLLVQDYEAHGTSFSLGSRAGQISLKGFAFYPEALLQKGESGDSPQDEDEIQGFSFSFLPYQTPDHALTLTSSYYRGSRRTYDEDADAFLRDRGDGWSLAAESSWFEDTLRVRGELATARFDAAAKSGTTQSKAYRWGLTYQPWQEVDFAGNALSVAVDLDYEWVGAGFQSLIGDDLDDDEESLGASMALSWGNLSADIGLRQTIDNVEARADQATNRNLGFNVSGRYQVEEDASWLTESAWLGRPYVEIGFDLDRHRRWTALTDTDSNDRDEVERTYSMALGSDYEQGSWSLQQTLSRTDDKTADDADRFGSETSLGAAWQPHSGFSFESSLGWSFVNEADSQSDALNFDVDFSVDLIPERLDLTLGAAFDLSVDSAGIEGAEGFNGELKWHFLPATTSQPGLTWAFQGTLETGHGYDDSDYDGMEWMLFGELQLTAPLTKP